MDARKKILIITHTMYIDDEYVNGPADTIKEYFLKYKTDVDILFISLSMSNGGFNIIESHINGDRKQLVKKPTFASKMVFKYFTDLFFVLKNVKAKNVDIAIAADPLNYMYISILGPFAKINRKYYYSLDYAPERFNNGILNFLYHKLDYFAAVSSDICMNAAIKISDIRKKQGVKAEKIVYIPNGPLVEFAEKSFIYPKKQIKLVIVFSTYNDIDFNFMFKSVELIAEKYKNVRLLLIGKGDIQKRLTMLINDYKVDGFIELRTTKNHDETMQLLSDCDFGIEANTQKSSHNEFRDPIKIREYIAFGMITITKSGHAIADEIISENLGHVTNEPIEFFRLIDSYLQNQENIKSMREHVLEYSKKIDKKNILDKLFVDFC